MACLEHWQAVMCEYAVDDMQLDVLAQESSKMNLRLWGSCKDLGLLHM